MAKATKVHLGLRVDPALRKAIDAAASHYDVTATQICLQCIEERLRAAGFMENEDDLSAGKRVVEKGDQGGEPEGAAACQ